MCVYKFPIKYPRLKALLYMHNSVVTMQRCTVSLSLCVYIAERDMCVIVL